MLAAYIHLLQLGFLPQNITFLGKSAGGNLALVLLRYLNDIRLPLPGKVGMMAPWCDLTMSFPSYTRHKDFDGLSRAKLLTSVRSAMRWYTPEGREYFSPALAGKGGWEWLEGTEVYMQVGTRELFEDEVNKTAEDMRAAGVQVRVREVSHCCCCCTCLVPPATCHGTDCMSAQVIHLEARMTYLVTMHRRGALPNAFTGMRSSPCPRSTPHLPFIP